MSPSGPLAVGNDRSPAREKRGELGAGLTLGRSRPHRGYGEAEGQLNGSADGTCEHWPVTAARSSRLTIMSGYRIDWGEEFGAGEGCYGLGSRRFKILRPLSAASAGDGA